MAATPRSARDEAAVLEVAYDEAARALAEQLALFDSFRNRAGWLLSAAAITTSVLGARALHGGAIGFMAWVALGAFLVVTLLTMAILWPRSHEFATDSAWIIDGCIDRSRAASLSELHRALTLQMQRSYEDNWADLGQMAILFEVAGGVMAIEILAWIAALASVA